MCRSLDCNTYTGTLTHTAAVALTIGDGTSGAGNRALRLVAGMTYTLGNANTSSLVFVSSSATVQTITTGGKTTGSFSLNTGSFQLLDAHTIGATGGVVQNSGTFDTTGQTCSWGSYTSTTSSPRTVTFGASAIALTGTGTAWNTTTITNLTFNSNTSTITLTGTSPTISSGGVAFNNIVMSGSGTAVISGTLNCANFTRTGTAVKTDGLNLVSVISASGTVTLTGNSVTNRLIVFANTIGTSRSISAAVVALTNVDFMDIQGTGAATWTGTSLGDSGGNTGITFDAPTTQTNTGATGSWSDVTKWTSRVPLPQDTVVVNTGSGTITADMPRLGASIDFTGFTGLLANSLAVIMYGSLTLASGMTFSGFNSQLALAGRSTHTITSAGKTIPTTIAFNGFGGSYTLQDALSNSAGGLTFSSGTFTTNNFTVTAVLISAVGANVVTNFGSSTVNLTTTTGSSILYTSSATLNAGTSNVVISTASTSTRTLAISGRALYTVTYTVANSPGALATLAGSSCTITNLVIGPGRQFIPASGQTVTTSTFNVNGAVNGYVYLPGVTANYASAPDSVALSVTGDIDIRVRVALDAWQVASVRSLVSKYNDVGGSRSYMFATDSGAAGRIRFYASTDGTLAGNVSSTAAVPFANGDLGWVRVTRVASTGVVQFFTSTTSTNDPTAVTWTQLGTDVASTSGNIFDSTVPLEVNTFSSGVAGSNAGKFYRAAIYTTIAGSTPVFDADFTTKPVGANTAIETSGNTVYYTGGYLKLPGVAGQYVSTPDSAALSITGDIDLRILSALPDWTPAAAVPLFAKRTGTGNQRSWYLRIDATTGLFRLALSQDGVTETTAASSAAPTVSDGSAIWLRATWRASDGRVQFFTASSAIANPIASDFTQLGTNQTIALASIFDSTALVEVGSTDGGTAASFNLAAGNFYRAQMRNGLDGTLVYDADFTTTTSQVFRESSSNAAPVTVNGAVTINGTLAQVGDGRVSLVSSTGGSAATMTSTNRQSVNYLSIQDSTVDASPPWYAGANSTNVSGNTNWLFVEDPTTGGPDAAADGYYDRRNRFIYRSIPTIGSGTNADLWLRYLATVTGGTGTEYDLTVMFLRMNGGTGEKLSGLWRSYLNSKGYSTGTIYDDQMALFASGTQT